ncbi:MAG: response regulator [Myxococcales bacterium]
MGRIAAIAKEGRRRPECGTRKHARYDTFLEVGFDSGAHLCEEYARNIGRGGLFVRTEQPPPLRAQVRLRLKIPDGSVAETSAEVVHVVTPDEARGRRTSPGAGLAFATGDTLFQRAISQFVEGAGRKLRVLVADDDEVLRQVLGEALAKAGFQVDTAKDGTQAMEKLGENLFGIDLLLVDLELPEVDGYCLIDRVRRLGGELDLKIAVFSTEKDAKVMPQLIGPGGADAEIRRGTPTEEIVVKVKKLLGEL